MRTTLTRALAAAFLAVGSDAPLGAAQGGPSDPDVVGQWSAVKNAPVIAIHSTLLPNGKVIFWDRNSDAGAPSLPVVPSSTTPRVWDAVNNPTMTTFTTTSHPGHELFCSSHVQLRDGRLFVAGGHNNGDGYGLNLSYLYDPVGNTWTQKAPMNAGRWYPTATLLGNGDVAVVAGSITPGTNNTLPQVYLSATDVWKNLTGAVKNQELYPLMHLAPNGKVFKCGPNPATEVLDTEYVHPNGNLGRWQAVGNTTSGVWRDYGTSVMYDPGKVLLLGGGPPTASAETIDLNAPTPVWQAASPMSVARRQLNALILADGKVLVTGGTSGGGFNNHLGAVLTSEIWDPATGTWNAGASMQKERLYHSETVLLLDGRVLSIGGGHPPGDNGGAQQYNAEIYSPPYLFKPRPTITWAPSTAGHGQTIHVKTPSPSSISKVHLIRLSSVTHAFNVEQRICRLTPTAAGTGVDVPIPASPNVCPPGFYQLVVVDAAGVPSTASMIRIDDLGNVPPVASAVAAASVEATSPSGAAVQVDASGSSDPGGGIVEYQWYEGATLLASTSSPVASLSLGVGAHALRLRVLDALGLFAETPVLVTVVDTTAPSIQSLSAVPFLLRPADGSMVAVPITATATDLVTTAPAFRIVSIASSEPDPVPGAPGDQPGDVGGVNTMTAQLRAERWSLRRVYTITVEARDAAGNASTAQVQVEARSKWLP